MISDKDLRDAARAYEKAIIETLQEPEDDSAQFSPAFERKMKKLIFRVDHPVMYWLSRLLPVLLLLGLLAGCLLLNRCQTEEPPAPDAGPVVYRPTWLPEGCDLERETFYEDEAMMIYRTANDTEAVFMYSVNPLEEPGPGTGKAVSVDGWPGVLYLGQSKGDLNDLFWRYEDRGVSFWFSAPFQEEDMLRVAESVEAQEAK